ncbi:MAG: bifunctional 23S rRNA (guanine(2069)-N(7))-methyltransferase RlmK/23S rRNA (guanine(2445)-N(2))-methyltransferase RlmL [Pirellulales bacterium]
MELVATAAFGVEKIVQRELSKLGYDGKITQPGRILFPGDALAICRSNLWLRSAERILIRLGAFPASDFGLLFDGVRALEWEAWIPPDGEFPVRGRSHKSQLTSVPAVQSIVKKAIVERLRAGHHREELPETGSRYPIEVVLLDNEATLYLDTTGVGLHKRGYRTLVAEAQLRETLAAAMVQLSVWRPDRPLIDPFCGTGTIPIEAALVGRRIAPGLKREFAAEAWPAIEPQLWKHAREEARDLIQPPLAERIVATDIDPQVLQLARHHAGSAGVESDIHFQEREFADLLSKRQYGCVITNPPYGERMGFDAEITALYQTVPLVLRRLPTWSHYLLTSRSDFEQLIGQQADRRRKLYNGRIECTLYQFLGPKPGSPQRKQGPPPPRTGEGEKAKPVFGGLKPEAKRQGDEFANRLTKLARHLRRWPTKRGITCYRIYDRDIPEVPLVVDRYEDALHIAEYDRPHDRTPAEHADWLQHMVRAAAKALDVDRKRVFVKRRERQRGAAQYQRVSDDSAILIAQEGGLKFKVNLSDYLDTGLFLDHRQTRAMVRDEAVGKRFLNLFGYTGAFSVYATAGGAATTTTVDLSPTYLAWAEENMRLNGFLPPQSPQRKQGNQHQFLQSDAQSYIDSVPRGPRFDLVVVDPPTFSNSKRTDEDWDVQQHHAELLNAVAARLSDGGVIYFSTNFRRFKFDEALLPELTAREITRQTIPEDFRNKRIHRAWRLVKKPRRTDAVEMTNDE